MDFGNLQARTAQQFDAINFNELNLSWIEELVENEFSSVDEAPSITTSILFSDCDPLQTLISIAKVCNMWCTRIEMSSLHGSRMSGSSMQEEFLWTHLAGMDITVSQILGLIYLLCSKANKSEVEIEDIELGLGAANLYFSCLKVPGTSGFSVYYPMLFRTCIDCLFIPEHIPDNKDKVWAASESLLPMIIKALDSLLPLLTTFHLGTDVTHCNNVIKKLAALVSWELNSNQVDYMLDYLAIDHNARKRRFRQPHLAAALAFQGLLLLINTELNGDMENNYSYALHCLSKHILMRRLKKKQTVTGKFLTVKENVVKFICYTLNGLNSEELSKLCVEALKRLCLSVADKTDIQHSVSQAIFEIMFHLKIEDIAVFVQWLLLLADSAETGSRTFAVDALGKLLGNIPTLEKEKLPENLHVYLSPLPLVYSIFTRCDDISPSVRTRALTIISEHMSFILPCLQHMDEVQPEQFDDEIVDSNMNGDHRIFWYKLESFREVLDEIAAILLRRVSDNNVSARKGALQALENLINFDPTYLSDETLKLFHFASKDGQVSVRRQMVQSLTSVLNTHHSIGAAQDCWLKCVLPLVHDPETTSQAKVLQVMEERFLFHVFDGSEEQKRCTFSLLGKLSSGEFLSHQRYLTKAFSLWQKESKLRPKTICNLEKYFDSDVSECVWFYISVFSSFAAIPPEICQIAIGVLHNAESWENYSLMEHIIKTLSSTFKVLSKDDVISVTDVCKEKISNLSAPVELQPLLINILHKIQIHLNQEEEFKAFADGCMKPCIDTLSLFLPDDTAIFAPPDDTVAKTLTVLKEFCQLFPNCITEQIRSILKVMIWSEKNRLPVKPSKPMSVLSKAHAFAAVGKLCLQDETLATEVLSAMAAELVLCEHDAVRNNVVIAMIEMCKRYTAQADQYVPIICLSFKDRVYIIRYQAITLLINLLQEDYIKWKGGLLFCLLSTINDKKEAIVELGKYCLTQLLLEKKKEVFSDHFLDSIFVFNHFAPPDNQRLSKTIDGLKKFAIRGDGLREERMQIYRFMLEHMQLSMRALVVNQLCSEVLQSVAGSVFPLNDTTECIVRDVFAILSSKEVRAYDSEQLSDDLEEGEQETAALAEHQMRRVTLIDPLIQSIINLRYHVVLYKSPLINDILLFLVDILQDYKSELGDILEADKLLRKEVERKFASEAIRLEEEEKERKKRNAHKARVNRELNQPDKDTDKLQRTMQFARDAADLVLQNGDVLATPRRHRTVNFENDEEMLIQGVRVSPSSRQELRNDLKVTSTPHVMLRPLSRLDISDIIAHEDMDID